MTPKIDRDQSASEAVILAVSSAKECDPRTLTPLDEIVDTDALDALSSPRFDGTSRIGARVSFVIDDYTVIVDSDEYLTIQSLESRP